MEMSVFVGACFIIVSNFVKLLQSFVGSLQIFASISSDRVGRDIVRD